MLCKNVYLQKHICCLLILFPASVSWFPFIVFLPVLYIFSSLLLVNKTSRAARELASHYTLNVYSSFVFLFFLLCRFRTTCIRKIVSPKKDENTCQTSPSTTASATLSFASLQWVCPKSSLNFCFHSRWSRDADRKKEVQEEAVVPAVVGPCCR